MTTITTDEFRPVDSPKAEATIKRNITIPLKARGEPALWALGGALSVGIVMILGFLLLVFWNGFATFIPKPVVALTLKSGELIAGEPSRTELYKLTPEAVKALPPADAAKIAARGGYEQRTLYRTGNYDLNGYDFKWVDNRDVARVEYPADIVFVERLEWGAFVGRIKAAVIGGKTLTVLVPNDPALLQAHEAALERLQAIRNIERNLIGHVNYDLERLRLKVRRAELSYGPASPEAATARASEAEASGPLKANYERLAAEAQRIRQIDQANTVTLADVVGKEKTLPLSSLVRFYAANNLTLADKIGIYFSRWWEFLSTEPREANTEGGVLPAIFGTVAMTLLMVLMVAPVGVITALYLREYAKQGRLV
ncbi:MAG: hypothetical protein ACLPX9_16770, partial [Rhodomicrobium sp.]